MNCPKCNKSVSADARFCGSCGQPIEFATATVGAASATASKVWADAKVSAPGLLARIKNIVLSPGSEWQVIAPEATTAAQLYGGYVTPLAVLTALIGFLRMSVMGVNTALGGSFRMPISSGLTYTVLMFVSALIGVFVVGLTINALAPTFSGTRDQRQALKVSAYSLTPAMLSSVLSLSPVLPTLLQLLAGLFGIYVLYLGLPVVMRAPKEKAFGYTASVVICTILLGILLGVLSAFAHIGGAAAHQGLFGSTPTERAAEQAAARDQGAAAVGNTIGNLLGTDEKGKAGLGAALSNLAKAGENQAQTSSSGSAQASTAQSPLSAAGGLMTALGGALGGPHPVNTVDFKTLTSMLPASLPGMKRTSASGENQGALGVKASSAKADYQGSDGGSVHIEIADMSGISGLMDLAGSLVQNTTSESDSGYEKDVVIGGRSVHEKFEAHDRKGDLSVLVAKRYTVDISGTGVDMHSLEQSLGQIDLAHLESMKDAGAQAQ
jgi:Yip1 domain